MFSHLASYLSQIRYLSLFRHVSAILPTQKLVLAITCLDQFMRQKLLKSVEEKEKLFHTALVKCGVKYELAAQAARVLASGKPGYH
jgi:hypothetical protein